MYSYDQHLDMLRRAGRAGFITADEVIKYFETKKGVEEARLILADFLNFLVRKQQQ